MNRSQPDCFLLGSFKYPAAAAAALAVPLLAHSVHSGHVAVATNAAYSMPSGGEQTQQDHALPPVATRLASGVPVT